MNYFLKPNKSAYSDQLQKEAQGLAHLAQYAPIELKLPKVVDVDEKTLKLEQISSCPFNQIGFQKLAKGLAKLHQEKGTEFGLDEDNYIGLNPQINVHSKNWGEFFLKQRLCLQVDFIQDSQQREQFQSILQKHTGELLDFLNQHTPHPSPVHGDLWSGNILFDGENPWLIDPAFYFADREVDIAMTQMFGGFSKDFYQSYNEAYPLKAGYEKRFVIYNLYHYLNHYNLFGSSYLSQCKMGFELISKLN
jgi:fructosamine-3-kinase